MKIFIFLSMLFMGVFCSDDYADCLVSPELNITAGVTPLTLTVGAFVKRCSASVVFDNAGFLPISYDFESALCAGQQEATFVLPDGVPSGGAYITWQCVGGTPVCYRATITGGQGFPSLAPHHDKLFACVTPLLHTTASFETIPHGNNAVTQTRVSTITSLSTSYASPTGVWTDSSASLPDVQVPTSTHGNTLTTTETTTSSGKQQTTGGPTTAGKTTTGKTSTGVTETTFKELTAGTPACTCTGQ